MAETKKVQMRGLFLKRALGVMATTVAMEIIPDLWPEARAAGKPDVTPEQRKAEMDLCRVHLSQIGEAILAYRQAHQKLPDRLSDLLPEFLADPKVLHCPASRRIGRTSYEEAGYTRAEINDPATTYLYEFRTNTIPVQIGGGSPRSMRDWKQLQMGFVGSKVPIVRCYKMHDRYLNLPFEGEVYESGHDWEDDFANIIVREDLTFTRLFARNAMLRVITVQPRPPGTPHRLLDLSPYFNASLTECGSWEKPEPFLTSFAPGVIALEGVPFDVRGAVQLNADAAWLDCFPKGVTNVPVNLPAERLNFLHATLHRDRPGATVGEYVIHYEDGQTLSIPLRFGEQLNRWKADPVAKVTGDDSSVAWTGAPTRSGNRFVPTALYRTRWTNPLPRLRIRTLELRATPGNQAGLFLIAVTAEP